MSFWESPCWAKSAVRLARPDAGGGMLLLAPAKLAVVESRRPTFTSQLGPPSYTHIHTSHMSGHPSSLISFSMELQLMHAKYILPSFFLTQTYSSLTEFLEKSTIIENFKLVLLNMSLHSFDIVDLSRFFYKLTTELAI